LNVAKEAQARVGRGLVKLVRAVLWAKESNFERKTEWERGRKRYLDFGVVWRDAISNKTMWCP
jgi:hypothetical protein